MCRFLFILLTLISLAGTPGVAQETEAPPTAPAEAEADQQFSTAGLAKRADDVTSALRTMQEDLEASEADTSGIAADIDTLEADLEARLLVLAPGKIEDLQPAEAETLLQTLNRMTSQLQSWRDKLQQRSEQLDEHRRQIKLELDFFTAVASGEDGEDLPGALVERANGVIEQLENGRVLVDERLDSELGELTRISALMLRVRDAGQLISTNKQQHEREALTFDRPPIWTIERSEQNWRARVPREFRSRRDGINEFNRANEPGVIVAVLLLPVVIALMVFVRRWIVRQGQETDIDSTRRPFVERPISLALLLWAIIAPQLFLPTLPSALAILRLAIVFIALLRLLPLIAPRMERSSLAMLLSLSMLSGVQELLPPNDLFDRILMIFISVAGGYLFVVLGRALKDTPYSDRNLWWLMGRVMTSVAPPFLGISVVALLIGAFTFANQAIHGTLYLLTILLALVIVENSLVTASHFLVAGPAQRWLRSVRRYPDLTRRRLAFVIRLTLLFLLFSILPRVYPLMDIVYDWLTDMLTADMSIGTVGVSLEGILTLVLSIVIALYVAKFIRFTLDEDIFPRMPIATGAAAAASRLIYYALVMGGILFALAAGGVELTKLTLLISALGVGIGFGLQGIVNNFVSGLVLAFERPFQVGDIIAVDTLTGRVRQIGLRASRVRTFDGAEVIVPNADLIAGNVINWTLSDRMRRLDLKVGVSYGTDPGQVREILLKVAEDSAAVSKDPEPAALFDGFGDSSLDFTLRAWIPEAGDWPQITSDLNEAINAALKEAVIEIPFPQRTLHIRSDDRPV